MNCLIRTTPGSRFHGLITEPDALADGLTNQRHRGLRYGRGSEVWLQSVACCYLGHDRVVSSDERLAATSAL